jgi:phosphohistidine swiveling domain-containing protein
MAQVDRFSVLCSILKNHFGRSGVVTSKESYSPVPVVVTSALVVPVIVGRELAADFFPEIRRP